MKIVNYKIQVSIESRLSTVSYNKKYLKKQYFLLKKALQNSGHKHTLTYKHHSNDDNSTKINTIKGNRK